LGPSLARTNRRQSTFCTDPYPSGEVSHNRFAKLEDINQVFSDLKAGKVDGRVVITM
jgi:D-arabinose 1-dehydrogenase-like Zn-dependent alcohol dehydrogenase